MEILIIDFSRRIDEPNRRWTRLAELARVPLAGLDAPPRVLGAVVGLRGEAVDRLGAEPRLQPLGEARPVFAVGVRIAEHRPAALAERGEIAGLEANRLDRLAELDARELLAQPLQESIGFARRPSQSAF